MAAQNTTLVGGRRAARVLGGLAGGLLLAVVASGVLVAVQWRSWNRDVEDRRAHIEQLQAEVENLRSAIEARTAEVKTAQTEGQPIREQATAAKLCSDAVKWVLSTIEKADEATQLAAIQRMNSVCG